MATKARGSKIGQIVQVKGQRKVLWQSETGGHVCTDCSKTIEAGELYTRGVGSTPVCRGCGPFETEEETQSNDDQDRAAREAEASYRRGYTYATEETVSLVLQLAELGYKPTEIRRLMAVYEDHMLAAWRAGDLDKREAAPAFNIEEIQAILAGTSGYDWIV